MGTAADSVSVNNTMQMASNQAKVCIQCWFVHRYSSEDVAWGCVAISDLVYFIGCLFVVVVDVASTRRKKEIDDEQRRKTREINAIESQRKKTRRTEHFYYQTSKARRNEKFSRTACYSIPKILVERRRKKILHFFLLSLFCLLTIDEHWLLLY